MLDFQTTKILKQAIAAVKQSRINYLQTVYDKLGSALKPEDIKSEQSYVDDGSCDAVKRGLDLHDMVFSLPKPIETPIPGTDTVEVFQPGMVLPVWSCGNPEHSGSIAHAGGFPCEGHWAGGKPPNGKHGTGESCGKPQIYTYLILVSPSTAIHGICGSCGKSAHKMYPGHIPDQYQVEAGMADLPKPVCGKCWHLILDTLGVLKELTAL